MSLLINTNNKKRSLEFIYNCDNPDIPNKKRKLSNNDKKDEIDTIFRNEYDIRQCIEIYKTLNGINNKLIPKDINKIIAEYGTGNINNCSFCKNKVVILNEDNLCDFQNSMESDKGCYDLGYGRFYHGTGFYCIYCTKLDHLLDCKCGCNQLYRYCSSCCSIRSDNSQNCINGECYSCNKWICNQCNTNHCKICDSVICFNCIMLKSCTCNTCFRPTCNNQNCTAICNQCQRNVCKQCISNQKCIQCNNQ